MENNKEQESEKAIFIRSFKTKRLDGHSIRTIYVLMYSGVVSIERRIVSTELNEGFRHIRAFGKYIYQREVMIFKFDSFIQIVKDVELHLHEINIEDIIRSRDVKYAPNDKRIVKVYTDNKN